MPAFNLSIGKILSSHFRSLLWVAVTVAFAAFSLLATETIKIDFLNINPHRSQSHAASLPFIFGFVFLIITTILTAITFSLSQITQAITGRISIQQFGERGFYIVAAATPLMAILSWYCYDYLTPSDFNLGINEGANWVPYQHGLTIQRYLVMLGLQSYVTIFSIVRLKFEICDQNLAKKKFLIAAIVVASTIGVAAGIFKTQPNLSAQSHNPAFHAGAAR